MHGTLSRLTSKGTTTVGAVAKDGIVLASDTRVTMGSLIVHRKGKKVYKVDDHLAMTISGVVADAQRTVEMIRANSRIYRLERKGPMPVAVAARLASNLFSSHRLYPLMTQVAIGGVDGSGPHLFSLDPFGSVTEERYVATGSGSPIAYGILEERYREDLELKEVLPIVAQSVNSAMKRDVTSGDDSDVVIIDQTGYHELSAEEKKALLSP